MKVPGKVILVTGSGRGIGAAIISGFAELGYRVVINFRSSVNAALALRDAIVQRHGEGSAIVIRADVSARQSVTSMFDAVYDKYGRLDVLVNNAGINIDRPFVEMTDNDWSTVHSTILGGTFMCSQEFAKRISGRHRHIVNLGALTAIRGRKNGANYSSARAGVLALTKCLAQELAPDICVNSVTPGWIGTDEVMDRYDLHNPVSLTRTLDSIPLRRLGLTDDVFNAVKFLVNGSTYVTGQNLIVDGGMLMC